MKYFVKLGEKINLVRTRKRHSLRDAAQWLNMDYSHLAKIEQGDRNPSLQFYPAIANYLEVDTDEIIRLVSVERVETAKNKLNKIPFLSNNEIERIAVNDRNTFLDKVGRTNFSFPSDVNRIPYKLYNLDVIESDMLFGVNDKRIYAGLFPSPFTYHEIENAIAVATQTVRNGKRDFASPKTIAFQVLHEMGHFRLHWLNRNSYSAKQTMTDRPLYCSQGDNSPPELQANLYASAFLMPRNELFEMLHGSRVFNFTSFGKIFCDRFYVEPWTLKQRLKDLGIRNKI
jgi:transcriptional regulator with XRE-family HTH domain